MLRMDLMLSSVKVLVGSTWVFSALISLILARRVLWARASSTSEPWDRIYWGKKGEGARKEGRRKREWGW